MPGGASVSWPLFLISPKTLCRLDADVLDRERVRQLIVRLTGVRFAGPRAEAGDTLRQRLQDLLTLHHLPYHAALKLLLRRQRDKELAAVYLVAAGCGDRGDHGPLAGL